VKFHLFSVVEDEQCQPWKDELIEVIDTEKKDSEYTFPRKAGHSSCQLEPLISYHNSTVGVWQFFNLSGNNVLALHNVSRRFSLIKVCLFSGLGWEHCIVFLGKTLVTITVTLLKKLNYINVE